MHNVPLIKLQLLQIIADLTVWMKAGDPFLLTTSKMPTAAERLIFSDVLSLIVADPDL